MIRLATALALAATAALVAPASAATTAAQTAPSAAAAGQDTAELSGMRSFAARHRVTTEAPVPGATVQPARAAQSDGQVEASSSSSCVKDTQRDQRDVFRLDIASTTLSRCDGVPQQYVLKVGTYDVWDDSDLDGLLVVLDTDVAAGTGCDAYDFYVIGYDDVELGLIADVVQTPSCDDSSWTYRGEARIDRAAGRTDVVRMSWEAAQIGSPRDVRYITDLTDGTSYDSAPDAGNHLLTPNTAPRTYPTPVARDIADTCDRQVGTPFIDTIGTTHAYSINCVSGRRITKGTSPVTYEPDGTLSRGQTATFLVNTLRAAGSTPPSTGRTCLEDDVHADSMSLLIGAGIIPRPRDGACSPAVTIDRELMALWTRNALLYGLAYGDRGTDWYSDDDMSDHEAAIDEITSLGVVTGKGDALYGPQESLTRGQMATFLARSLDAMLE